MSVQIICPTDSQIICPYPDIYSGIQPSIQQSIQPPIQPSIQPPIREFAPCTNNCISCNSTLDASYKICGLGVRKTSV